MSEERESENHGAPSEEGHAAEEGQQLDDDVVDDEGVGADSLLGEEEPGKGEEEGEEGAGERVFFFQWPDATVTIARSKDEETLRKEMSLLGSVDNCRVVEYTGPLQINLKLAPLPGVWKDDPQYLDFVDKYDHQGKLGEDLTKLYEGDRKANFADVKFVVEGKDVYAHKAVLASRCETFRKGFVEDWKSESREGEVSCYKVFKGIRHEVFAEVLRYVYTAKANFSLPARYVEDDIPISKRNDDGELLDCALQFGVDILQAAEAYGVAGLKQQATQFLAGFTLYPSKLFAILIVAHRHALSHLKSYCLQMLAKHDALSILELLSKVDMPFDVLAEVNKIRTSFGLLSAESVKCQKLLEENKGEELLSFLDSSGIDLDQGIVLHLVSGFGAPSVIKAVLERGAEVNHPDDDGNTPLHYATISAQPENVSQLLKSGANPFLKNSRGRSPAEELEYIRTLGSEAASGEGDLEDRQASCEQLISSHAGQVLEPIEVKEQAAAAGGGSRQGVAREIVLNPDFVRAIDPKCTEAVSFAPASSHGGFLPYAEGRSLEQELVHFMLPNTCMALLRVEDAQHKDGRSKDGPREFGHYLEEHGIRENLLQDLAQSV